MLQEPYVAVPFTSSQQQKPAAACCVRFTSDGLSMHALEPAPERGSRGGFRKDGSSFSIGSKRDRHGNGSDNRARAQQLKARLRLQKAGIRRMQCLLLFYNSRGLESFANSVWYMLVISSMP